VVALPDVKGAWNTLKAMTRADWRDALDGALMVMAAATVAMTVIMIGMLVSTPLGR
jgi:hypothetical protein